jgi:hypothetical protein
MTSIALLVAKSHALLVARPTSPVLHIYAGPLTLSGRWVPSSRRTACRAHTRRLTVLARTGATLELGGRRVCARCSARLFAVARRAEQPVTREQWLVAYAGVTLGDLATGLAVASTTDETHSLGFVAKLLHGAPPVRRDLAATLRHAAVFDLHAEIVARRRALIAAGRTPEEIEAAQRQREAEAFNDQLIQQARRRDAAIDRAVDRRNRGGFLLPHERQLVDSA